MSIYSSAVIISFVFSIHLGAVVFYRNPTAILNRLFIAEMVLASLLIFVAYELNTSHSLQEATFWWRFGVGVVLIPIPLWYFVLIVTESRRLLRRAVVHAAIVFPSLTLFALAAWKPELLFGPPVKYYWGWYYSRPADPTLFYLASAWYHGTFILALVMLALYYRKATDVYKRQQAKYVLLGIFVTNLAPVAQVLRLAQGWNMPALFPFTCVIALILIGYAIRKNFIFGLTPVTTARHIVTTMIDGLLLVNGDREVAWCNDSAGRMTGYGTNKLIGVPIGSLLSEDVDPTEGVDPTASQCRLDVADQSDSGVSYTETRITTRDGNLLSVSLACSILSNDKGVLQGYIIIFRDISERIEKDRELDNYRRGLEQLVERRTSELLETNQALVTSRQQLRFLGERLANAKEEESARIARELHDELGQLLTSIKIELTLLEKHLKKKGAEYSHMVRRCASLLDMNSSAIKGVQEITKGLRPPMLDDIGLAAALKSMVKDFEKRTGIACSVRNGIGDERYEPAFSTAVYRIVQESLTNVARHAEADAVSLAIEEERGALLVSIGDNGKGIQEQDISNFHSFGILGMVERARSFGGELKVSKMAETGTAVQLSIPIRRVVDENTYR